MLNVHNSGTVDALKELGSLSVPMVIIKEDNISTYKGFIPGFVMKNVINETLDGCKADLKKYLKQKLVTMAKNNLPFPFFPTKEEILKDFDNVVSVEFIKISSSSRKSN